MLSEGTADVYTHSCFQVPLAPVSVTELVSHRILGMRGKHLLVIRTSPMCIGQSAVQLTLQAEDMLQNSLSPIFF